MGEVALDASVVIGLLEPNDAVDGFIEDNGVEIVAVDRALARLAAQLRADHPSLRLADSLVLASARARGAELLTFDDRLRRAEAASRQ